MRYYFFLIFIEPVNRPPFDLILLIDEFWEFYEQLVLFLRVEFDAARDNNQGCVLLFDWDWDGFNLKNYASADG